MAEDRVLYSTHTLCPQCTFAERKEPEWQRADVVAADDGKVYVVSTCPLHATSRQLYCSNTDWFLECLQYDPQVLEGKTLPRMASPPPASPARGVGVASPTLSGEASPGVPGSPAGAASPPLSPARTTLPPDIEDLAASMQFHSDAENQPLMCIVPIHEHGEYVDEGIVLQKITGFRQIYQTRTKSSFVLKLTAMLSPNTGQLTRRVKRIMGELGHDTRVLVESSSERLVSLINYPDSVFLDPRVYPSLKICVEPNNEEEAERELRDYCKALQSIREISTIVTLAVSRPVPRLAPMLTLMRRQPGVIRGIVINLERPATTVTSLLRRHNQVNSGNSGPTASLDPYELLKSLEVDTNGFLCVRDFLPASACMLLEPFLDILGFGRFNIRPSPLCGFVACFVNTERYTSTPVTRLVDMPALFRDTVPLVKAIEANGGKITLPTAMAIKKAVLAHVTKGVQVDNFVQLSIKGGLPTASICETSVYRSQFVILHNTMDVAAVDLARRTRCALCSCNLRAEKPQEADQEQLLGRRQRKKADFAQSPAFGCNRQSVVQFVADCTSGCV
eukprot:TRINITY_DN3933_c0_g1_i1.p1 TRINITY_DN3933_c0_g1~~TRINITY_DN3933_c0_g1_i1.p1  ORF type:complete len:562 (+),score=74.13 TRINITY_DN3933_c0_g1_i1:1054-2739(+)